MEIKKLLQHKNRIYAILVIPLLFFIGIILIAVFSEQETLIKIEQENVNIETSVVLTINEIEKDYIHCDVSLSCPRNKFNTFTISTNNIKGIDVDSVRLNYFRYIKTVRGEIDFLKTSVFELNSDNLRNYHSNKAFHNFYNLKLLIPLNAYENPISDNYSNLHLSLGINNDTTLYTIKNLKIRNLDKKNRISILTNKAYIENEDKSEDFEFFADKKFNKTFFVQFSRNNEFQFIISFSLTIIIVFLLLTQIYLIKTTTVDTAVAGIILTIIVSFIGFVGMFHKQILDTKSILELVIYSMYFWILFIIGHTLVLIFIQKEKVAE